jgi:hypothetical protein
MVWIQTENKHKKSTSEHINSISPRKSNWAPHMLPTTSGNNEVQRNHQP